MLLHDLEELDDDLRARSDKDLALAGLLGVVEAIKRIVEDGSADHLGGVERRFSNRMGYEVSAIVRDLLAFRRPLELGECPH